MSGESQADGAEDKTLANIFHLISQPMTALQCSLEFALNALDDPGQCRSWIEAALENSERLRCRLSLAREMAYAAEPDDAAQALALRPVLEEALSEAAPLFHQTAATPRLQCDDIEVYGERSRLLRALFYVLQNLRPLENCSAGVPEVMVERKAESVEVRFSRFVFRENRNKDQVASQLQIAKEIFASAGGGLLFFCFAGNDAMVRIFLRAPQAQLDLYEGDAWKKPARVAIGATAVFPQVS